MKKLAIPTILAATIMVAGMFAFMPVEQASTVHTSGTTTLATGGIGVGDIADNAITADALDAAGATQISDAVDADNISVVGLEANAIGATSIATNAITAAAIVDAIAPQVVPLAACANLFDTDITGGGVTATMNKDFTLYVLATGTNGLTLTITGITGGTYVHTFATNNLSHSFALHAVADEIITLVGSTAGVDVNMTLMSSDGAAGDCL